jgi:hypothetical protein
VCEVTIRAAGIALDVDGIEGDGLRVRIGPSRGRRPILRSGPQNPGIKAGNKKRCRQQHRNVPARSPLTHVSTFASGQFFSAHAPDVRLQQPPSVTMGTKKILQYQLFRYVPMYN